MTGIHRLIRPPLRLALLSLALVMTALTPCSEAQAQVQRQSGGTMSAQVDPNAVRTAIDPLKAEVLALRTEVNRLHAALESLRLTVNANQAAYVKHRHGVASYGVTSAKTICPNTPVIDGTMVVIAVANQHPTALSGPPE
jgi:hypothetical protein